MSDTSGPTQPNYLPKVIELCEGCELTPGVVNVVQVLHDDWCAHFTGDACNCSPELRIQQPEESHE